MPKLPVCFVIMPITTPITKFDIYNNDDNHFTNVLEHLFRPALDKAGFETVSPKSKGSDLIHADIITNLSNSDLVLCDMSTLNPNVFFEFGIRCALNKPAALVIDDKTEQIPFDTGIINCHTYNSAPLWNKDDEIKRLSNHITETFKKSPDYNAIWKYFGIKQTGAFNPENATTEDKLNFIIDKITTDGVLVDYKEKAFSMLTPSELQVLHHISKGKTNRDIANILELGEGTVRNYVSSILAKLDLNNRAEAATYATKYGLVDYM